MSQLKCNPLHYAIATLTSATTFNQKKLVAKLLWLPFLGLLLHFFGVAVDRKSCSVTSPQTCHMLPLHHFKHTSNSGTIQASNSFDFHE